MKRIVKISESKFNEIIKKVIKEQEDQYMSGVDQGQMSGSPEDESGEINFEEFIGCAQGLISQGVTIGGLIDKLIESQETPAEEEASVEQGVEDEIAPVNESKKVQKKKK